MDSPQLERMVRQLWAEREEFREKFERQRDQLAEVRRALEELALACCLSEDEGLKEWSQELGEGHPRLERLIEHKVNRYLNEKHFRAPALLDDVGGAR